jgi:hypothetical protein
MPEEDLHLSDPVRSRAYGAPASCRPSGVFAWTRATHEHDRLGGAIPARGAEWLNSRGIRGSWRSPAGRSVGRGEWRSPEWCLDRELPQARRPRSQETLAFALKAGLSGSGAEWLGSREIRGSWRSPAGRSLGRRVWRSPEWCLDRELPQATRPRSEETRAFSWLAMAETIGITSGRKSYESSSSPPEGAGGVPEHPPGQGDPAKPEQNRLLDDRRQIPELAQTERPGKRASMLERTPFQ